MASGSRRPIPLFKDRDARATTLQELLDQRAQPGELWHPEGDDGSVRCTACGHLCLIRPGRRGICKVRFNRNGTLYAPRGYAAGIQVDPTEKKPFYHVLPGSDCLTFGMLGCDFHCAYCQNWLTSQALRDPEAGTPTTDVSPETLIRLGRQHGARVVASSYNEPLITSEWAMEIFRLARPAGFKTAFVSNGNATPQVLDYIRPYEGLRVPRGALDALLRRSREQRRNLVVGRSGRLQLLRAIPAAGGSAGRDPAGA